MSEKINTRRVFIKDLLRYFVLTVFGILAVTLFKRKSTLQSTDEECINRGICANCSLVQNCRLPQAGNYR